MLVACKGSLIEVQARGVLLLKGRTLSRYFSGEVIAIHITGIYYSPVAESLPLLRLSPNPWNLLTALPNITACELNFYFIPLIFLLIHTHIKKYLNLLLYLILKMINSFEYVVEGSLHCLILSFYRFQIQQINSITCFSNKIHNAYLI
jgi:hypothetical protein